MMDEASMDCHARQFGQNGVVQPLLTGKFV